MWKRVEVVDGVRYRIGLSSSPDGHRTVTLVRDGDDTSAFDFVTQVVEDFMALQNRNLAKILDGTPLIDGTHAAVDAHNVWFTAAEIEQLEANNYDLEAVAWHRETPPQLAPK